MDGLNETPDDKRGADPSSYRRAARLNAMTFAPRPARVTRDHGEVPHE